MDCSMTLMILILISAGARNMKAGSALQWTVFTRYKLHAFIANSGFSSSDSCWRRTAIQKLCHTSRKLLWQTVREGTDCSFEGCRLK